MVKGISDDECDAEFAHERVDPFEQVIAHLGAGEVERQLVARSNGFGTVHPQHPIGIRAAYFAIGIDHFRLEPQAELHAQRADMISERLEAEYAGAARQVMKRALLDALDKLVKFDLPPSLVEAEASQIAHQLWHEENPDVHDHNHDKIEPTDEHKKLAERRVRLGLLLAETGRKAEIEVTDAEMTQAVMAQARQYPGQERQFFEFIQQNAQMQQQLRAPIFEDKVVDHILAQANVTEKEISKDELQKAVEALDEE